MKGELWRDTSHRRSLSWSQRAGNGRRSFQSNDPFLFLSGPLPEPVINGEMEEKVRRQQLRRRYEIRHL